MRFIQRALPVPGRELTQQTTMSEISDMNTIERTVVAQATDGLGIDHRHKMNGAAHPRIADLAEQTGAELAGSHRLTREQEDAIMDQILAEYYGSPGGFGPTDYQYDSEDEIWEHACHGGNAALGMMGLDDALLRATALCWRNYPAMTDEQIADRCVDRLRELHPGPWDETRERWKARDKIRRYREKMELRDRAPTSWRRTPGAATEARERLQADAQARAPADYGGQTGSAPGLMTALEYGVSIMKSGAAWTDDNKRVLLEKMNAEHAVVAIGNSVRYLHRVTSGGQDELRFLRPEDMKTLYEAVTVSEEKTITTAKGSRTETVYKSAFELWRKSPERPQYDGIGFYPPPRKAPPRVLNLWTGLAIEPRQGEWGLFGEHLLNVVCGGNQKWFEWLLDYMAHAVQRPGEKPGSAVVLYSPAEGTGKTILNKMMGRIFGRHAVSIDKSDQFLGKFNAAIEGKIWLATEEAFWGGEKKNLGAYKSAITEDRRLIEKKGVDPYEVDDYSRVVATSNETWNTPAGVDGRRFFVLAVDNPRAKDPEYFDPIWQQMERGGVEAMLFDLLRREIKSNLRNPPETPALMKQRQLTLDGVPQWLLAVAEDGGFYDREAQMEYTLHETEPTEIPKVAMLRAAVAALPRMKPGQVRTDLGAAMKKLGVPEGRPRAGAGTNRGRVYRPASLDWLRDALEAEYRVKIGA
jgi:hypothetical protein